MVRTQTAAMLEKPDSVSLGTDRTVYRLTEFDGLATPMPVTLSGISSLSFFLCLATPVLVILPAWTSSVIRRLEALCVIR